MCGRDGADDGKVEAGNGAEGVWEGEVACDGDEMTYFATSSEGLDFKDDNCASRERERERERERNGK